MGEIRALCGWLDCKQFDVSDPSPELALPQGRGKMHERDFCALLFIANFNKSEYSLRYCNHFANDISI